MSSLPDSSRRQAPGGPALAGWLATDHAVSGRELTDGRHTVTYAETAELLARLDRRLARHGGSRRHPVALECSQCVAGALAILYLLSRELDTVLLPELGQASKEVGTPRFIPSFCSHVITAAPSAGGGSAGSVVDDIAIAANDAFREEPALAGFVGPDLYLRTSGSTGIPKLARMSHQKWLDNAAACVERWRLTAADRLAVPVPIFHSYGFGAAFLPGLLAGAAMDFGSGGNILRYLEREGSFAPNVAFLTPALCDTFLAVRKSPRPYRLAVTAGDKIKRETMAGFEPSFGPLLNLYGSAEMGAVSSAAPDDPPAQRLGTAGYPLAGIELRVVATEVDAEVAGDSGVGMLQCRQRNGFDGYLVLDQGWRFEPRADHEWFSTGDLATIRADKYLEVRGRAGLSVKRDGLLVVFAEVEAAVEKAAGVRQAVVVAAGESRRGARLVAVCLADPAGEPPPPGAVRQSCFDLLPRYAVPDEVVIVSSLPRLPSGKIDRRAVRELAASLTGPAAGRADPAAAAP
jgi:acyl-CoA synthetase (AMP-forming)/AMP-acid ligase II